MARFLIRRIGSLVATAWMASVLVFVGLDVLPGDPAAIMLGTGARPDTLSALRVEMGLDRPAVVRYLAFATGLATGDLGRSLTYDQPVGPLIAERLGVTLPLAGGALAFSTLLGLPLGLVAAARRGRGVDWLVMSLGQVGVALPSFWLAILLVFAFATGLGWLPAGGFPGWDAGIGPAVTALILPTVALALPEGAVFARVARAAALDTLGEDYVRTARAKGVGPVRLMLGHVLPNASIPMLTVLGLQCAFLVAGAIVIENVFHLPGLGRLLVQAIGQRDLVIVRDVVTILAGFVVGLDFIVDVAIAWIDPRPKVTP